MVTFLFLSRIFVTLADQNKAKMKNRCLSSEDDSIDGLNAKDEGRVMDVIWGLNCSSYMESRALVH